MEPTLQGPQRVAYCETCQQSKRFSAESISENRPTQCPQCGTNVSYEGWLDGEEVQVDPFKPRKKSILRGEIVILRESNSDELEVKRAVGLPYESLKFINGDLWVDGQLFQKSMPQFLSQAIDVERWSEIEGTLRVSPGDVPIVHRFQYLSLWPQFSQELRAHPSPILDEYRNNAAESRKLIPVRDIGFKLSLSPEIVCPAKLEVQLWVDDAVRSVQIAVSSEGIEILTGYPQIPEYQSQLLLSSFAPRKKRESLELPATSAERTATLDAPASSAGRIALVPWYSHHLKTVIVAMVDGRVLVGNDQRFLPFNISNLIVGTDSSEQNPCSADTPITLKILEGELSIMQAIVVRDIHYRGWHGETEFTLPATNGYHVLGDNVSNSADSRQRWPDGVSPNWIIGRIQNR